VLTRPDRPKGRGLKAEPSPVKRLAQDRGLTVLQPATLKSADGRAPSFAVALDVLVVAAYGQILPPDVLAWPRYGCLNIHASRLPRWRGAAPIQRAIQGGDAATGITIMQMDEGLDTGPMIECIDVDIAPRETAGTLHDKLAVAGARAIVEVLTRLARDGALSGTAQPATGVTYANKVGRAEAAIDWTQASDAIDRAVRAFDPVPGASAAFGGSGVKVWRAEPLALESVARPHAARVGTVLAVSQAGVDVACGQGALRLLEVQPASGKRMSASAFAAGRGIARGACFDTAKPG
jgi:methionyl-tRNA formyltransferase